MNPKKIKRQTTTSAQAVKRKSIFWFEPYYEIEYEDIDMFDLEVNEFGEKITKSSKKQKLRMIDQFFNSKVDSSGNVTITRAYHDHKDENSA